MTLDFLLRALRRTLRSSRDNKNVRAPEGISGEAAADDEDQRYIESPFDEPVVVELRDVIDLHSIPPAQVSAVVHDYLDEAHRKGFRWIRIIHGKGIGVQRAVVHSILSKSELVAEFHDAPPEAGGLGATVATLRSGQSQNEN